MDATITRDIRGTSVSIDLKDLDYEELNGSILKVVHELEEIEKIEPPQKQKKVKLMTEKQKQSIRELRVADPERVGKYLKEVNKKDPFNLNFDEANELLGKK